MPPIRLHDLGPAWTRTSFLRNDANAQPVANTLGALNRDDLRRLARVSAKVINQTIHGLMIDAVTPDLPPPMNTDDETEGETGEL